MLNKDKLISDLISSLYSIHIISHKAYEIFKTEGVRGFKARKIHILDCDGNIVDTTYYSLQYTGLISINYDEMGITCKKCDVCGMEHIVNQEFTYETLCFDESTWDGSDICVGGYCTCRNNPFGNTVSCRWIAEFFPNISLDFCDIFNDFGVNSQFHHKLSIAASASSSESQPFSSAVFSALESAESNFKAAC